MGKLVVLDSTGHSEVRFSPKDKAEAKARFKELLGQGHIAYRMDADGKSSLTRSFDETAEEIVMHPQLVGG